MVPFNAEMLLTICPFLNFFFETRLELGMPLSLAAAFSAAGLMHASANFTTNATFSLDPEGVRTEVSPARFRGKVEAEAGVAASLSGSLGAQGTLLTKAGLAFHSIKFGAAVQADWQAMAGFDAFSCAQLGSGSGAPAPLPLDVSPCPELNSQLTQFVEYLPANLDTAGQEALGDWHAFGSRVPSSLRKESSAMALVLGHWAYQLLPTVEVYTIIELPIVSDLLERCLPQRRWMWTIGNPDNGTQPVGGRLPPNGALGQWTAGVAYYVTSTGLPLLAQTQTESS